MNKHGYLKSARIALSIALIWLVLRWAGAGEIWSTLRAVRPGWILAALALAGLDRLLMNQRWRLLLAGLDLRIGLLPLSRLQLAASFFGSFLPSSIGVDAIRMASLCRLGFPAPSVVAATLVDRMSLAAGTLALGAGMLLFHSRQQVPELFIMAVAGVAFAVMAGTATALAPAPRRWFRRALLPHIPSRFRGAVEDTLRAAILFRHQGRMLVEVCLLTLAIFVLRIALVATIGLAVGAHASFFDFATVVPILWIIVMLPITVGALGVQDAGYIGLMALIGVPAPLAASMSLIEHVIARIGSLPGAFLTPGLPRASEPRARMADSASG